MRSQWRGFLLGLLVVFVMGATVEYNFRIKDKQRAAGATVLGSTPDIFAESASGWNPLNITVINPSASDVRIGVRWNKNGSESNQQTYRVDLPGGTSKDFGGFEIDSLWVNHTGTATNADSLYWEASR